MTMKAHTYYIIFGRPPIGGSFPPPPLAAPLSSPINSTHYAKLYPQNGERNVTVDSVTSIHPMYYVLQRRQRKAERQP